jgi:integrase
VARRIRAAQIDTRSNRLKLPVRRKPHAFTTIAPGIALGYRRTKGAGSWVMRAADGKGGAWTSRVGTADDFEDADGEHTLSFWQALDKARLLARGQTSEAARPATWAMVLDDYEADLRAREGDMANANRVRRHLTPALLAKPVGLLTAAELKRWRNDLIARGLKPATVLRTLKAARASLNMAADHDPARITNRNAWRVGLSGLTDTYAPVNKVLPDNDVLRIVAEAYALDERFGLVVDVLASTGTRTSQACRLVIHDLQADRPDPRLLMPSSRKGKRRRKIAYKPVPIPASLALKLQRAAGNREPGDPLLTRADGTAWNPKTSELIEMFAVVAERVGLAGTTAYALRHSSIVRSLLAGTPTRLVASLHDSSTTILEQVYSAFIADHGDAQARVGLLDTGSSSVGLKVVPLKPGRR